MLAIARTGVGRANEVFTMIRGNVEIDLGEKTRAFGAVRATESTSARSFGLLHWYQWWQRFFGSSGYTWYRFLGC
jgi:hypothetical protein